MFLLCARSALWQNVTHPKSSAAVFVLSDWNWTDKDAILQEDAEDEEHKIQYKHRETQHSAHLPATGSDGHDDKEEHEEEQHDGAEQAIGADGHRLAIVEQSVHEPWDRQTKTRGQIRFSDSQHFSPEKSYFCTMRKFT